MKNRLQEFIICAIEQGYGTKDFGFGKNIDLSVYLKLEELLKEIDGK